MTARLRISRARSVPSARLAPADLCLTRLVRHFTASCAGPTPSFLFFPLICLPFSVDDLVAFVHPTRPQYRFSTTEVGQHDDDDDDYEDEDEGDEAQAATNLQIDAVARVEARRRTLVRPWFLCDMRLVHMCAELLLCVVCLRRARFRGQPPFGSAARRN